MPEIFRVPLDTGYLALHADPDSETGLFLEAHNGEEGVLATITVDEIRGLVDQFGVHAGPIVGAEMDAQAPDTAA
jgi:hypothetical protein